MSASVEETKGIAARLESCFSKEPNDYDGRQMEEDVNYTRSLKMNLTRSGYLRARSVEEGASEARPFLYVARALPRETVRERERVDLPLVTLPRQGFRQIVFRKTWSLDALASWNARWFQVENERGTKRNSRKLSPVLDFPPLSLSRLLFPFVPAFLSSLRPHRRMIDDWKTRGEHNNERASSRSNANEWSLNFCFREQQTPRTENKASSLARRKSEACSSDFWYPSKDTGNVRRRLIGNKQTREGWKLQSSSSELASLFSRTFDGRSALKSELGNWILFLFSDRV